MPYGKKDAARFTKKARGNPKAARAFAHAANDTLKRGGDEGKAARIGNFAAKQSAAKKKKKKG